MTSSTTSTSILSSTPRSSRALWLRWVGANAFGELFGLGLTLLVGLGYFLLTGEQTGAGAILAAFGVAVASGAIEASIVGLAQWWAMRPWFPGITRRAWWLGTLGGALLAYVLGYLPSTLISLAQTSQAAAQAQPPVSEPPQWVVPLLAAALGAVSGAILSAMQWPALRGKARRAGLWIPANMLAWLAGMPVIFWAIDRAQAISSSSPAALAQAVVIMALALLVTGAVVGAIHGVFLIKLRPEQ